MKFSLALIAITLLITSGTSALATANEFAIQSAFEQLKNTSNEASVQEMARTYSTRITEFGTVMNQKNVSSRIKAKAMKQYLHYAQVEINNQTGGSGVIHTVLTGTLEHVKANSESGNYQAATQLVSETAKWVLSYLE